MWPQRGCFSDITAWGWGLKPLGPPPAGQQGHRQECPLLCGAGCEGHRDPSYPRRGWGGMPQGRGKIAGPGHREQSSRESRKEGQARLVLSGVCGIGRDRSREGIWGGGAGRGGEHCDTAPPSRLQAPRGQGCPGSPESRRQSAAQAWGWCMRQPQVPRPGGGPQKVCPCPRAGACDCDLTCGH